MFQICIANPFVKVQVCDVGLLKGRKILILVKLDLYLFLKKIKKDAGGGAIGRIRLQDVFRT